MAALTFGKNALCSNIVSIQQNNDEFIACYSLPFTDTCSCKKKIFRRVYINKSSSVFLIVFLIIVFFVDVVCRFCRFILRYTCSGQYSETRFQLCTDVALI